MRACAPRRMQRHRCSALSVLRHLGHAANAGLWERIKYGMNWLLDDKYFTAIMTIVTIWALFGDDIRLLATEKPADEAFVVLTIICLIGFSLELREFPPPPPRAAPPCPARQGGRGSGAAPRPAVGRSGRARPAGRWGAGAANRKKKGAAR